MFSSTLKAENSAPCWNSMPTRLAAPRRAELRRPAGRARATSPCAGVSSPRIWRSSTVLPVPEPPTSDSTSPRSIVRSRSWWTPARALGVLNTRPQLADLDHGFAVVGSCGIVSARSYPHVPEQHREQRVDQDHHRDRGHHRSGGALARGSRCWASTRRPKWQAISAISMPNTTDLTMRQHQVGDGTARGSAFMKKAGEMPSAGRPRSCRRPAPPSWSRR